MENCNRRHFLQVTAAGAAGLVAGIPAAPVDQHMRLGLIINVEKDADKALKLVHDLGIPTCQAQTDDFSDRAYNALKDAIAKYGIEVTAVNSSGDARKIDSISPNRSSNWRRVTPPRPGCAASASQCDLDI